MFLLKRLVNHKEYIPLEVQLVKKKIEESKLNSPYILLIVFIAISYIL